MLFLKYSREANSVPINQIFIDENPSCFDHYDQL
jgi:hypothetical protein